jgi:hypothetical protein
MNFEVHSYPAKPDKNGNWRWYYQFVEWDANGWPINHSRTFRYFGRFIQYKDVIASQVSPKEMLKWLNKPAVWLNMDIGKELKAAQKRLDHYHTEQNVMEHSRLMGILVTVNKFLRIERIVEHEN